MENSAYGNASVLLFDPQRNIRRLTRGALENMGFLQITEAHSLEELRQSVTEQEIDLLIAEASSLDGQVCGLIRQVRHNKIGENPFLGVILTTWETSPEIVRKAINAGTDDLLAKPLSTTMIAERIEALVKARKPFVVTSSYIGPDRRKGPNRDSNVELLEVPNSLREKVEGKPAGGEARLMRQRVAEAISRLNDHKVKAYDFQIGILVGLIQDELGERVVQSGAEDGWDGRAKRMAGLLGKLLVMVRELSQAAVNPGYAQVQSLCPALIQVVLSLRANPERPSKRDVRLLKETSMAIHLAFDPNRKEDALADDISATITRMKERQSGATV